MRRLFALALATVSLLSAENVLITQSGAALTTGDWINVSGSIVGLTGTRYPYYVTGWDKQSYVPGIDAACDLGSYFEPSSEPNRSWACYSFTENRWWMVDMGPSWHDEYHSEGGHPMGWEVVDPTTSVIHGPCCFSGSQVSEEIKWGNWEYDFVGNVGIPHMTLTGLTQSNQLGSAAYDPFDQLLVGMGGDSSNQGTVLLDLNPTHVAGCSSSSNYGTNCYNSYDSGATTNGSGPPASIIEHAMATNTADKKIYVFGGYYSGATQSAVYTYTPTTNIWAQLSYTCRDALGGTNCPVGRILAGWAYDANDNIFLMHGGSAVYGPPVAVALDDTWIFDPVALTFTQVNTPHQVAYNRLSTTLSASMALTDTSLTIASVGNFAAPAMLRIDSEAIVCMTLTSNTYSGCTRGYENTTPAAHSNGATVFSSLEPDAPNERLVWFPEDDVFALFVTGDAMWEFRYAGGSNAGYKSNTYQPTIATGIGPLNRNESGFSAAQLQTNQSYAMGSALAVNGTTLYQLWTETAVSQAGASPANSNLVHPYAQYTTSFGTTNMGNAYNSLAPDVSGTAVETFNPSLAVVGSTPWACWDQQNINIADNVQCSSWNGSAWSTSAIGTVATTAYDAFAKVINNSGTSTILFREQDRTTGNVPYPTYAYVKQWNGSGYALLGGAIGQSSGWNVVDSADIASDGTNPWVVTSEYVPSNVGSSPGLGVNFTNPKVYLYKWTGSAWAQQCSTAANVTGTDDAFNVAITMLGATPYVSFVERAASDSTQKLYVRTCNGTSWSTVGSGSLNRDKVAGWAFRAELANDGTNLYAAWTEQGNDQPWLSGLALVSHYSQPSHLYVAKYAGGGTWSALGAALNIDPALGAATHPAIAILSGNPIVQWGERSSHNLRQMYAKQWNGTDWVALAASSEGGNPSLSCPNATTGTVGTAYSSAFSALGGTPAYTYSISSGSLPTGLSLNGSSGLISGTPTSASTYSFVGEVTDANNNTGTASCSITIGSVPTITTGSPLPSGTVGVSYSDTLAATNSPTGWALVSGTVCAGLNLNTGSGVVSGIPTTPQACSFGVTASNGFGTSSSVSFSLTIAPLSANLGTILGGTLQLGGKVIMH